jgi:hypothetical protein
MKTAILLVALVFGQYYEDDRMDLQPFEEDPSQWDGAQDPFEGYQEQDSSEPVEQYEGDYEPGMYFAGNGVGSTPAERMVLAAADGPKKYDCKNCGNDVGCLTSCSTYVVRARVTTLEKRKARVQVLCNYKGTPPLVQGASGKSLKARKRAKRAKKAKKAKKPKKTAQEFEEEYEDQEYDSNQDFHDYELDFEEDSRLVKRSKGAVAPRVIRVRIPASCANQVKADTNYTLFLAKSKKGGYRLYGGRKACNIRPDTDAIQTEVLKGGRSAFQGPQCSIGGGIGNRSLKAKSNAHVRSFGSSLLVGAAMAFI